MSTYSWFLSNFDETAVLIGKDSFPNLTINTHYNPIVRSLKDFSDVEYGGRKFHHKKEKDVISNHKDLLFDMARLDIYELKRNGLLTYERCYDIVSSLNVRMRPKSGNKMFSPSDVRAKAKAMYEWTLKYYVAGHGYTKADQSRAFKKWYHKNKGEVMTRQEAGKVANKASIIYSQQLIKATVEIMKKTDEKITVSSVARLTNQSRNTVAKYLKLYI